MQNLRRCAGYKVQYFGAIEPQRRLAPHIHVAMRGAIPRAMIRAVTKATYLQLWWPPFDQVVSTDSERHPLSYPEICHLGYALEKVSAVKGRLRYRGRRSLTQSGFDACAARLAPPGPHAMLVYEVETGDAEESGHVAMSFVSDNAGGLDAHCHLVNDIVTTSRARRRRVPVQTVTDGR